MGDYQTEILSVLKEHWLKLALLSMAFYLVITKEINVQLQLNAAHHNERAVHILSDVQETKAVALPAKLDLKEGQGKEDQGEKKVAAEPVKKGLLNIMDFWLKPKESIIEKEKKPLKTIKEIGNLTLILSPDYIDKYHISKAQIKEKMDYCISYVKRFVPVAIEERKKYGIPASIKLAQALLESNVGDSRLCKENNNHFGIKCFERRCSKNHCSNFTDDSHKDFFRKYPSSWESFRAHSEVLESSRYKSLKKIPVSDYKAWAFGLRKAGYATDKAYAEKLILIIEALELWRLDLD